VDLDDDVKNVFYLISEFSKKKIVNR